MMRRVLGVIAGGALVITAIGLTVVLFQGGSTPPAARTTESTLARTPNTSRDDEPATVLTPSFVGTSIHVLFATQLRAFSSGNAKLMNTVYAPGSNLLSRAREQILKEDSEGVRVDEAETLRSVTVLSIAGNTAVALVKANYGDVKIVNARSGFPVNVDKGAGSVAYDVTAELLRRHWVIYNVLETGQ